MKLTEMIHRTTLAFRPAQHPIYALIALAMMLTALVVMIYISGAGVASAARAASVVVKLV